MSGDYSSAQRDYAIGTCPLCGKQCYASKGSAKRAAKILYPGRKMRPHKCGDYWHFTSMSARRVTVLRDWRAAGPRSLKENR